MANGNPPVLRQSVRWGENYVSRALNEKFSGILPAGIYRGFVLKPSAFPMTIAVTHDNEWPQSIAIVERNGYSISVIMYDAAEISIPAKGTWNVCIEAFYSPDQQGYQRIVAKEDADVTPYHVVLGKVVVASNEAVLVPIPADAITTEDRHQKNPLGTLTVEAQKDVALMLDNQAEILAQMARLANRLTKVELEHAAYSAGPGEGELAPQGKPLPGGGSVAPITILPQGTGPVTGAALTAIVDDYTAPTGD